MLVWIGLSVTATEPNKTYEPSQKSDPCETSVTSEASETSDMVSFCGVDSMVYPIDGIDVEFVIRFSSNSSMTLGIIMIGSIDDSNL